MRLSELQEAILYLKISAGGVLLLIAWRNCCEYV